MHNFGSAESYAIALAADDFLDQHGVYRRRSAYFVAPQADAPPLIPNF
jgi:hypothetical protein